ncbi:hypothetical protein ACPCK8_15115 [Streptomyces cellulosae]
MTCSLGRRLAVALLVWVTAIPGTAAALPAGGDTGASDGAPADAEVLRDLERIARPLRTTGSSGPIGDLRPFGAASGTPWWSGSAKPRTARVSS